MYFYNLIVKEFNPVYNVPMHVHTIDCNDTNELVQKYVKYNSMGFICSMEVIHI